MSDIRADEPGMIFPKARLEWLCRRRAYGKHAQQEISDSPSGLSI
jgi:hypothetical protein